MLALERRWVLAILGAFAPEGTQGLSPRPGEVDYLASFHALLTEGTPLAGVGLRLGLWLVALSPLFVLGRFATFLGLDATARTALLGRLLEHDFFPLREATFLLKTAAALALFRSEAVRARSLYDGPKRPGLPVVGGEA